MRACWKIPLQLALDLIVSGAKEQGYRMRGRRLMPAEDRGVRELDVNDDV